MPGDAVGKELLALTPFSRIDEASFLEPMGASESASGGGTVRAGGEIVEARRSATVVRGVASRSRAGSPVALRDGWCGVGAALSWRRGPGGPLAVVSAPR